MKDGIKEVLEIESRARKIIKEAEREAEKIRREAEKESKRITADVKNREKSIIEGYKKQIKGAHKSEKINIEKESKVLENELSYRYTKAKGELIDKLIDKLLKT